MFCRPGTVRRVSSCYWSMLSFIASPHTITRKPFAIISIGKSLESVYAWPDHRRASLYTTQGHCRPQKWKVGFWHLSSWCWWSLPITYSGPEMLVLYCPHVAFLPGVHEAHWSSSALSNVPQVNGNGDLKNICTDFILLTLQQDIHLSISP